MLKDRVKEYIEEELKGSSSQEVVLYNKEKEFAVKHELVPQGVTVAEKSSHARFTDAYIERVDKESENLISEESPAAFLNESIQYVNQHQAEFIYIECDSFDLIRVEGVSVELDDVFRTYKVLLGLRQPKKAASTLKTFLTNELKEGQASFQLLFNDKDGMWDVNIDLAAIEGFNEELSLRETFELIYDFLFQLVQSVEENS
ncbi:hypothetical protein FZC66_06650 [Priestia megaterium]|nr:hypothetical protein FZC66_06650 [Priestia megaterium]